MGIPESQLETWSHQGSITQSSFTYAAVKSALEAPDAKYASKSFQVFLQGSYGNDTNIYAESDVDVVIRLDDIFYYDINGLTAEEISAFNKGLIPASYAYDDYRAHVTNALIKRFGAADVKPGTKAIKIKANGNRRSSDVVVACQFRRYYSTVLGPQHRTGICFFTSNGIRIANYPQEHSVNCTTKHQATNQWFKPMVRILKNMRSKLADQGAIKSGIAPSYFLEGLLYNVPNDKFGKSYADTFVSALNWILNAKRDEFVCANENYYLVRNGEPVCWQSASYDAFIAAVVKLWNDW